jgi:hypothetical protein
MLALSNSRSAKVSVYYGLKMPANYIPNVESAKGGRPRKAELKHVLSDDLDTSIAELKMKSKKTGRATSTEKMLAEAKKEKAAVIGTQYEVAIELKER